MCWLPGAHSVPKGPAVRPAMLQLPEVADHRELFLAHPPSVEHSAGDRTTETSNAVWDLIRALHHRRPDLDAFVSLALFVYGMSLDLNGSSESSGYDVVTLLARADGDPACSAELVASDLPANPRRNK